jgi:hypothetical protein
LQNTLHRKTNCGAEFRAERVTFANFRRSAAKLPLINPPRDWTGAELSYVNNSGLFENILEICLLH